MFSGLCAVSALPFPITMMSQWSCWRLKCPASPFARVLVQAQMKENIKAPHHWPLWGEFIGEYPAQRASKVENVSIWWRHHVKQYSLEILHYWKECRELHDPYIYLRIHLIGHVTLAGNIGTIYRVPYRSVMSYQLSHSRINARAMTLTPGHQNVDRAVTSL